MRNVRSTRRLALTVLTTGMLALLAAGCTASPSQQAAKGTASGASNEIRLVTSEWKFDPGTVQVASGRSITLVLDNKGALEHDIQVNGIDLHLHAQARQTAQQTVTFDKPGTYEFVCTLPGHQEAGMKGKLVVGS